MLLYSMGMTLALGWALIACLWPRDFLRGTLVLRWILAAGLGAGISSLVYFGILVSSGGGDKIAIMAGECLCLVILMLCAWKRQREITSDQAPSHSKAVSARFAKTAFVTCLGLAIFSFLTNSVTHPYGQGDALLIWNLRARFLFDSGEMWQQAFSPSIVHPDYPIHIPGFIARTWEYLGRSSPLVPAAVGFGYTFGTVALLWASLRALGRHRYGLIAGCLLLGFPAYLVTGSNQYADVPLSFFFLAAVVLRSLHEQRRGTDRRMLYLSGFALGLGAWTKNEGIMFLLVLPACHALSLLGAGYKVCLAELLALAVGALPALLALSWFKTQLVPQNDLLAALTVDTVSKQTSLISSFQEIAAAIAAETWALGPALVVAIAVYLALTYRQCRLLLFAVPAIMLGGYSLVYLLTSSTLSWHLATSMSRLLQQLLPLVLFAVFYQRRARDAGLENSDASQARADVPNRSSGPARARGGP